jgi:hypothetical protein
VTTPLRKIYKYPRPFSYLPNFSLSSQYRNFHKFTPLARPNPVHREKREIEISFTVRGFFYIKPCQNKSRNYACRTKKIQFSPSIISFRLLLFFYYVHVSNSQTCVCRVAYNRGNTTSHLKMCLGM